MEDENQNIAPNSENEGGNGGQPTPAFTEEQSSLIAKMIQSATDKIRTDYSKRLKDEQAKHEEEIKKNMTEKQRAEFEKDQAEKKYEEEKEIFYKERTEFLATKSLNKHGLLDENNSLVEFVADKDPNAVDLKCMKLKKVIDEMVELRVKERFKDEGRVPVTSGTTTPSKTENYGEFLANNVLKSQENTAKAQDIYFK